MGAELCLEVTFEAKTKILSGEINSSVTITTSMRS
jgi:hypothetical protein